MATNGLLVTGTVIASLLPDRSTELATCQTVIEFFANQFIYNHGMEP